MLVNDRVLELVIWILCAVYRLVFLAIMVGSAMINWHSSMAAVNCVMTDETVDSVLLENMGAWHVAGHPGAKCFAMLMGIGCTSSRQHHRGLVRLCVLVSHCLRAGGMPTQQCPVARADAVDASALDSLGNWLDSNSCLVLGWQLCFDAL